MTTRRTEAPETTVTPMNPKVFISYSWSSPDHEQWVLRLATELRESAIDAILDKWDLKEGNDANVFMEKMVADPEIKKVVLVCDKKYAEKADRRTGGVGTEAQIISAEIYQKQDQSKFVAIIAERSEEGKPYLPIYYKSRVYIDLSNNDAYASNFEQLVRWVFDKPLHEKPTLGSRPTFLEDATAISLGTGSRFTRAIEAVRNNRPYAIGALGEYFDTFSGNLEQFRIVSRVGEFDDLVIENIEKFVPHRNEAVQLFLAIGQFYNTREAHNQLHRFFENMIPYLNRPETVQTYREWDFDNFCFIIHELFLYCIAALLKHGAFDGAAILLSKRYYVASNPDYGRDAMVSFRLFRRFLKSLEYRNSRLKLARLSLHADLLKSRCAVVGVAFEQIMLADFVLYLRDALDAVKGGGNLRWWPETMLWIAGRERVFEVFARAESVEYFDSIKILFDVETKEDFVQVFTALQKGKLPPMDFDYHRLNIPALMAFDSLGTRP
jgi:hypothetical protein